MFQTESCNLPFHPKDGNFLLICTRESLEFLHRSCKSYGKKWISTTEDCSCFVYRFQEALIYTLVRSSVGIPGNPVAAEMPGSTEAILLWGL